MSEPCEVAARNAELEDHYGKSRPDESGTFYYDEINPGTGLPYEARSILPTTRILLDSWKIRRTAFVALSTLESCRPYAYQLPPTTKDSEACGPCESVMEGLDLLEEMFLHHKKPKTVITKLEEAKCATNILYLRAKALENKNIEEEMFMKRGSPPPEPNVHVNVGSGENRNDDDHNGWEHGDDSDDDDLNAGDWIGEAGNANDDYGWGSDHLNSFDHDSNDDYDDDYNGCTSYGDSEVVEDDDSAVGEGEGNAIPGSWINGWPEGEDSTVAVTHSSTQPPA